MTPKKEILVFLIILLPIAVFSQQVSSVVTCSGVTNKILGKVLTQTPGSYSWEILKNGAWVQAPGVANEADYETSLLTNSGTSSIVVSVRRQILIQGNTSYDSYYDVNIWPFITNNSITPPSVTNFCTSGDPQVLIGSTPVGGTGTVSYQWQSSIDDNNYTDISGATSINYDPPLITSTTYYRRKVTSSSACSSNSNVITIVTTGPTVDALNVSVCPGTRGSLTATSPSPNVIFRWYAAPTGGQPLFTGSTFPTPVISTTTTYYVEGQNQSGCVSSSRKAVSALVLKLLPPVGIIDLFTASSITFKWNSVLGATAYEVSTNNGQTYAAPSSGSNGLSHVITGLVPGQSVTLFIRAKGILPCELSAPLTLTGATTNPSTDDIFVPNAFTPNNDKNNDILYIYSKLIIDSLKFSIYNQWGELLFTSTDQTSGWDGTYRQTKAPVGVYVYSLVAVTSAGNILNKKGTITLLK